MIRTILTVLAALLVGNLLIFGGEAINTMLFPYPEGFDFNNAEAVKAMVAGMPLGAFAGIELSYLAGSAGAGLVLGRLSPSQRAPVVVGILFTLSNLMNMAAIPHPLWFAVLTTVTFLPVTVGVAKGARERWSAE